MTQYSLPHDMNIAAEILSKVSVGVPVITVFNFCKETWPKIAPRSLATFYKIYRLELATAKSKMHDVTSIIFEKALAGDPQMLTLIAKGKLGWSDKIIVDTDPEEENEDTGAIDDLISLLNIKKTGADSEDLLI